MSSDAVGKLLREVNAGDAGAFESLVALVHGELRRMAGSLMRGQVNGHTLQSTALVNEAYMRRAQSEPRCDGKAHFFGVRVTFHDLDVQAPEPHLDLVALDEALDALGRVDERFTRVMELRYFAGCSLPEIAELTQVMSRRYRQPR
jgi:RNA polymerase sigma-70 factor, ECF subfamily